MQGVRLGRWRGGEWRRRSHRPRAVVIDATARWDADPRGFLARIVARVDAAEGAVAAEQGADIPPHTPGCRMVCQVIIRAFC